jgi:hypothetical protein
MEKKFAYMNGDPGYLPDYHSGFYFNTKEEAIQDAMDSLDLTEEEAKQLREFSSLYIYGERAHEIGASLVEIVYSTDKEEIRQSLKEY